MPAETTKIIDVKSAVNIASKYINNLFGTAGQRLEEVEISENDDFWFVTISFFVPKTDTLGDLLSGTGAREYKKVKIDAKTGEVKAVSIR